MSLAELLDLLGRDFMQRALLAALLTGLAAPTIGTFLVQRRLALLGDGIGHVAVTGVALGLLTGTSPTWTAVVVAILGAVLIEVIREQGHTNGDVALALLFYGGLAGGVLITGLAGEGAASLQVYLFGSVTSISPNEVWYTAGLAAVVLALTLGLLPQLFAVASDPEFARVAGLRVRSYNLLVAVLAAVSVTVAMRTVGLLLVSALMVVPVATSQQLARSFRSTLFAAMVLGALAAVGGLVVSAWLSADATVAPGPSIVLLALAMFAATWPVGVWVRRRRRLAQPFPKLVNPTATHELAGHAVAGHSEEGEHPHAHGDDCGHPAVPHGDHVDYVHDGHRHAPHGEHYDEH
jgi:zinc transport system permease protein